MDLEKLTKHQIILVTLLTSFVTSIATGIVTVSLMDQAPAGVTQTINRVVERTIEKVVSDPSNSNNSASVLSRETIVVKEDDQVVQSVDKNKSSVVRIYKSTTDTVSQAFIGLGVVINRDGLIATGIYLSDYSEGKYSIAFDNGKLFNAEVLPKKSGSKFSFLKIKQDDKNPIQFASVKLTDSDNLKLGQTVIAWGGEIRNSISTGIVSSIIDIEGNNTSGTSTASTTSDTIRKVAAIETNINLRETISGGPLLNLYGEVVGMKVSTSDVASQYYFVPSNVLKREMADISMATSTIN